MTSLRSIVGFAVFAMAAAGCYPQTAAAQQAFPEPVEVAGPPGGQMDPQDPYAQPGQPPQGQYDPQGPQQGPDDGQGYAQDPNAQDPNQMAPQDPSAQLDPNDPSVAMGDVTDQEIDQTLAGAGTWSDVDGYGRVWRPDATQVGADFTPYESGGTWVDTDGGWAFDTSDTYGWGWLPYHYGRWGWFDGYWGWQPGYHYGSSWVDWRRGGGYVGWRPMGPIGRPGARPLPAHDANWRFAAEGDLGRRNIRSHLFNNPAEGLRVTSTVANPGIHGATQVRATSLMQGHIAARQTALSHGATGNGFRPQQGRAPQQAFRNQPTYQGNRSQQQPIYRQPMTSRPQQSYRQQAPAYRQAPMRQAPTSRMPSSSYHAPAYHGSSSSHSSSSSYHSSGGGSHSSGGGGHSSGGGGHRR